MSIFETKTKTVSFVETALTETEYRRLGFALTDIPLPDETTEITDDLIVSISPSIRENVSRLDIDVDFSDEELGSLIKSGDIRAEGVVTATKYMCVSSTIEIDPRSGYDTNLEDCENFDEYDMDEDDSYFDEEPTFDSVSWYLDITLPRPDVYAPETAELKEVA